ncbi:unnamed protein product [Calicophoron daubneyi]|uniref:Multiple inositol polyphosphate phosphatase 1 n=1 Tax=Calicophoron daubneyi TaxID=300641 RepID=A0AAV2T347_CALDB
MIFRSSFPVSSLVHLTFSAHMVGLLTFGISETVYSFLSVALGIIGVLIARPNASVDLPLSKFGTKTAYRHCGLQPIIDPAHERSKQCRMVYVAGLFRHGTRAPSPSEITHIRDLYERLSSCQEAALPKNFLSHPIPFQNARGYELLPRGRQELYNLGRSFRKRVTSHFRVTRSNSLFYSSSSERAIHSAWSFYKGLFKLEPAKWDGYTAFEVNNTQSVIQVEDELLRFFETCERHAKQIRRGESSMKEYRKFLHGPQMHHMLQDIMKKHNIRCANLSTTDLTTLFVTCAHEVAVNSTIPISPWCGFFNAESLDILEYLGDLKLLISSLKHPEHFKHAGYLLGPY